MEIIFFIFIFIFGIFFGSFLGVVIDRVPRGESIVKGRSYCESCKKTLMPLDLFPVFSFLFLRGRCRHCHAKLSYYYPAVELITGVLFVLAFMHISVSQGTNIQYMIETAYFLYIVSTLIVICFIDLKYGIIPFSLIVPATIITFFYLILTANYLLLEHVLAGAGAFLFFLVLFLATRGRGMGFGDVVYVFFMGLVLGFPQVVAGLYIAFVSGAIISLILVWLKRKKLQGGIIPFGPFLVLGTLVVLLWGDQILHFILNYLTS